MSEKAEFSVLLLLKYKVVKKNESPPLQQYYVARDVGNNVHFLRGSAYRLFSLSLFGINPFVCSFPVRVNSSTLDSSLQS